jgi:hypothetical protein
MRRPLRPALVKASQDRRQKKKIQKTESGLKTWLQVVRQQAGVEVGEAGSTSVS